MMTPLQITMRTAGGSSEAIDGYVRQRVAKLDRIFDRITKCHVTIETPHRHKSHGIHYHVRVDLVVPGNELVVNRDPTESHVHQDAYAAIDAAFEDAQRVLKEYRDYHNGREMRRVKTDRI